jgi:pSer/pThr/pTyr-binding forkhead associated (FHA) protein
VRSGSAVGFVVLGACIGLFIGLAQVILKEAWIRVESGRRAGREMILTREATTIGRAESCDVGLFGDAAVEKLHARILLKNHRYLLADADTPGGTYLNDQRIDKPTPLRSGDAIRVGGNVLRFGERQKKKQESA